MNNRLLFVIKSFTNIIFIVVFKIDKILVVHRVVLFEYLPNKYNGIL